MHQFGSLVALFLVLAATGCSSTEDKHGASLPSSGSATQPVASSAVDSKEKDAGVEPVAKVAIASVSMVEDCPDPPPPVLEKSANEPPAMGASMPMKSKSKRRARAKGDSAGNSFSGAMSHCTQSRIQLSIKGVATGAAFKIEAMRLLGADKTLLSPLRYRAPERWTENSYRQWNESVEANADVKAAYKFSMPDWNGLKDRLPEGSYGQMFYMEIDVSIGGKSQTLLSPSFERSQPMRVKT